MKLLNFPTPAAMGQAAAIHGAKVLRAALDKKPRANIIVATGASQFETVKHLVKEPGIDWSRVTVFHLDEYVGLPESHGASFRKYLRERFLAQLPAAPEFIPVDGDVKRHPGRARPSGRIDLGPPHRPLFRRHRREFASRVQ